MPPSLLTVIHSVMHPDKHCAPQSPHVAEVAVRFRILELLALLACGAIIGSGLGTKAFELWKSLAKATILDMILSSIWLDCTSLLSITL